MTPFLGQMLIDGLMTPTLVENLLNAGPAGLSEAIANLEEFFRSPKHHGPLRLAVLGLVSHDQQHDKKWRDANDRFKELFKGTDLIDKTRRTAGSSRRFLNFHEHSISRFALGTHNQDERLSAYLALFVIHEVDRFPAFMDRPLVSEAFSLGQTLARVREYLHRRNLHVLKGAYQLGDLISTLRSAFNVQKDDEITSYFFGGGDQSRNVSYYAMYRYSTRRDEIVKSFIAILSPKVNALDSYSFTHVYAKNSKKGAKRVSRGAIVALQRSVYFLSGGGLLTGASDTPPVQGIKAFAIPYVAFVPDHRLLTGVMLSNSWSWQPIIARLALVHLGFDSKTGAINHELAGIRFLQRTDLAQDIKGLCERFKLEEFSEDPVKYVLEKMNNFPRVDMTEGSEGLLRALTIEEGREPPE